MPHLIRDAAEEVLKNCSCRKSSDLRHKKNEVLRRKAGSLFRISGELKSRGNGGGPFLKMLKIIQSEAREEFIRILQIMISGPDIL